MKKLLKYLLPVGFVVATFVFLLLSLFGVNAFLGGDWSALSAMALLVIIWLWVVTPVYCLIYSKIIQNEKLRVLFAFYNPSILVACFALPFIAYSEVRGYALMFFVWWLFFSLLVLKPHRDPSQAPTNAMDFLFQDKTKNIIAIIIVGLNVLRMVAEVSTWLTSSLSFVFVGALDLLSPLALLAFLLLQKRDYLLKKLMLPIAFAGELITILVSMIYGLLSLDVQLQFNPMFPLTATVSGITIIALVLMIVGALNFKYIALLKYGALGCVLLRTGLVLFNLFATDNFYKQIVMEGTLALNIPYLIQSALAAIYFMGIFILTTNKQDKDFA